MGRDPSYIVERDDQGRAQYLDLQRRVWVDERNDASLLNKVDAEWNAFRESTARKPCRVIPA